MALLRMGFLPNGLKRRLGAVSGKVNGCTYCTSHDCSILKNAPGSGSEGWSMTHEELTQLLRGDDEPGNEMERACFDFVRAASQNHGGAPDELYGRLAAQLTAPQIVALRVPIEAHLAGDTGYVLA